MTPPITMLRLTSRFDDEGVVIETSTWAIGASRGEALKAWKRACPLMASTLADVQVVTPLPVNPEKRLTGPRLPRGVVV